MLVLVIQYMGIDTTVQVAFANSGRETREKQAACDAFEAEEKFVPCTPMHMPMMECRSRNLLRRSCVHIL